MALSVRNKIVKFTPNPADPKATIERNISELVREEKAQWCDEVIISAADNKVVYANRKNIAFTEMLTHERKPISEQDHVKLWKNIFISHAKLQNKVAVYDTKDSECGFGLTALEELDEGEYLIYPGVWSFIQPNQTNFDEDNSYLVTLNDNNKNAYGFVDAKNHRNLATFALHAWPEEELENYQFSSAEVKSRVSTANMMKIHIVRPESIKVGPPFVVALKTIQKCRGPLTYIYSDTYFLSVKNIGEKFFDKKTGAVIDPTHYSTKDTYKIRVHDRERSLYYDVVYTKKQFADRRDIMGKNPNNTFFILHYEDFEQVIGSKPNNRFHIVEQPSQFFTNLADVMTAVQKRMIKNMQKPNEFKQPNPASSAANNRNILLSPNNNPGLYLRNLAGDESCSAEALNDHLQKMELGLKLSIINSVGGNSGYSPLHRAAEKRNLRKVIVLMAHGADKTLVAKSNSKTALDVAKDKGGNEALLNRLNLQVKPSAEHTAKATASK